MSTELFTEGKFSYHVLTPAHQDAAHAVLARAFCTEPACSDLAKIKPEMKTEYIDWLEFIDYWMEHCASNGLSVVALDKENCRVIARVSGSAVNLVEINMPPHLKEGKL